MNNAGRSPQHSLLIVLFVLFSGLSWLPSKITVSAAGKIKNLAKSKKHQVLECISGECLTTIFVKKKDLQNVNNALGDSLTVFLDTRLIPFRTSPERKSLKLSLSSSEEEAISISHISRPIKGYYQRLKATIKLPNFTGEQEFIIKLSWDDNQALSSYRLNFNRQTTLGLEANNTDSKLIQNNPNLEIGEREIVDLFFNKINFKMNLFNHNI